MGDWPKSVLHEHPDIAQAVGLVVADYALLEALMFLIYALTTDEDGETAFQSFYTLRSAHLREGLMYEKAAHLDEPVQNALRRLWRRFKAAANRRTEIAHVSFLTDGKTVTRLRLFGTEVRFEPITRDIFTRTLNQYQTLGKDLLAFTGVLARSSEEVQQIIASLPLARHRRAHSASLASQDPRARFETEDTKAALSRLQLLEYVNVDWSK